MAKIRLRPIATFPVLYFVSERAWQQICHTHTKPAEVISGFVILEGRKIIKKKDKLPGFLL